LEDERMKMLYLKEKIIEDEGKELSVFGILRFGAFALERKNVAFTVTQIYRKPYISPEIIR